ncbi:restriction endonuclease subunit S [Pseudooceanicola sp. 200-1SW]|uniref:restriction endonuclease subunit S n=1 Tax=Pseudooceanicola sp. 200-1SW TaxID=3425949 RepID=UPI003D800099
MPEVWSEKRLGDVIELKRGYDLPTSKRVAGATPIISSSGPTGRHNQPKVAAPGVVTGRYGTIGQVFYVSEDFWPLNTTLYVRDFKGNDPRFISYFLRGVDFMAYSDKAAVPGVNRNHLHEAQVRIPNVDTQKSVARVLGALDDKIELNRRMNETLEEMARALFRDWFVDFGPTRRQMAGATDPAAILGQAFPADKAAPLAPLFPATLGEDGLPEGWSKRPVGDLAEIVGGGTPSTKTEAFWAGGTHLWATPRDLSKLAGVFLRETERKLSDAGLAKVSSGLSPAGSVLMSSRAPIGYLAIASAPVAVNQGFIVLRPTERFPTHFAKLWCEANMETIESNANGSTFQEISKKNFKPILATVAPRDTMAAFAELTELFYGRIKSSEEENQTLAALRDLLLPKLMSGEIRLKDAEALS